MGHIDPLEVERVGLKIGEAALDPALWRSVMREIAHAVGATGAALLQNDVRTPDVPWTDEVEEVFQKYFSEGWHLRDIRARGAPLLASGQKQFITDQDVVTRDEMEHGAYYAELLYPYGFKWFAAIGFRAGDADWALSIHRTAAQGPFEGQETRLFGQLAQRLTEAATLSTTVGLAVISGLANALEQVHQPALVLDRFGVVLDSNAAAERIFDDNLRIVNRRLVVRDAHARNDIAALIDRLRATPDGKGFPTTTTVVRREPKTAVMIRAMPVPLAARAPFLGARVLLTLSELGVKPGPEPSVMMRVFGLTTAEAKLAALVATGVAPGDAADRLGISRETARNQLKAVFAKTETHRQSELVALISQLVGR
jgi:DNA-binding CsgD family transcriptional regulator/PAS domain-containing protein